LAAVALVGLVDAIYNQQRDDAPKLARCRRDAMAGRSIACGEYLGRYDERQRVCAQVEHKMADSHTHHRDRSSRLLVDPILDAPSNDEENGQNKEGDCEPSLARDAVCEEDEGGAPSNRGQGNCEQILLCLLYQNVVNGITRLSLVRLPDRESRCHPAWHCRIATGQGRVPT